MDLYGVISQEVVQYELPGVPEHALCVVPEAVEAQDFAVMLQELLQRVTPLVRPQWLHASLNLDNKMDQYILSHTLKRLKIFALASV